jgi:CheY-like chemotaxis protein
MPCIPHVVFVDDSLDDTDIARWRLAKAGIELQASVVCSEPELISELTHLCPDLIVSDFSMPGFDGWGALRVSQALAPAAPFIFHSGTIGAERCKIALSLGVYGCVEKNYSAQFVELVKKALMPA